MKRPSVRPNAVFASLVIVAAVVASPAAQSGQGAVTGRVTDSVTGAPVAGVSVTINPGGVVAVTGADGVYAATMPAGTISLMVSTPDRPFQSVFGIVVRSDATTTVNFTLALPIPTGVLTGLVRSVDGNVPLANATVTVIPRGNSTTTDANGRYELTLPVGTYTVNASAPLYSAASVSGVAVFSHVTSTRNLQLSVKRAVLEVLHIFASTFDGANPASLIQAADGDLYGVAVGATDLGQGTIFKMTTAGTFKPLHQFVGGDGSWPTGLIQGRDGAFYGATGGGGPSSQGTAFKMTSDGTVTLLHAFAGGDDGSSPSGRLVQGADGNFYGTTHYGGASDCGTVFKMTPDGIVTVLHAFTCGADGGSPNDGVIQATDGNFYGTTYVGGSTRQGTIYRVTSDGGFTGLHSFTDSPDGAYPLEGLIQASDGNLYGTTWYGGAEGNGTVFKMSTAGELTIVHSFLSDTGVYPSRLLQAADGNFYGTVFGDDIYAGGYVFIMTPDGAFAILHSFTWIGTAGGSGPCGGLIQGSDGNFYGATCYGGIPHEDGRGTLFRFTIPSTPALIVAEVVPARSTAAPIVSGNEVKSRGASAQSVEVPRRLPTMAKPPMTTRGASSSFVAINSGTVTGHVSDVRTNTPIPNAMLTFSPGGISITTGRSGFYEIALPAGKYTVTVTASNHLKSMKSGIAVAKDATTTLDFRLSAPAGRYSSWIPSITERADRTIASDRWWDPTAGKPSDRTPPQASAPHTRAWEIEAFGGATFASQSSGGDGVLPPAGAPFVTATGQPSRHVSSWYLGDGAQLLNGVNAALGLGQQIAPLDAALNASLVMGNSGGGGVRVSRTLTHRLTAEFTVEFSTVPVELSSEASTAIDSSSASFLSTWNGLASAGQFVGTTVTSVPTVEVGNGHQIVATGAINVALKKDGRAIPYLTMGGGVSSHAGASASVGVVGDYQFALGGVTPVHETDTVTVRYTAGDTVVVGVLGAGLKYMMSPRIGLRFDYRTYLGPNRSSTFLNSNPVVSTLSPAGSGASATTPGIQFSNDSSIGLESSLSGAPIVDFRTFTGSGMQSSGRLTIGVFWRF